MMPQARTIADVRVRKFIPADRERIREICRNTVLGKSPARKFFEDEELVSILFADYYMDYEPESCFVAEVDGRVISYALVCKDTKKYNKVVLTRIAPRVVLRILSKIITLQYRRRLTYRTLWWVLTRSWRELPSAPIDRYPAHLHWNIEPESANLQVGLLKLGVKVGLRLGAVLKDHFRDEGIRGVQAGIPEEEGDDNSSRFCCRVLGGSVASVSRFSLGDILTGKPWYAKLIVVEP